MEETATTIQQRVRSVEAAAVAGLAFAALSIASLALLTRRPDGLAADDVVAWYASSGNRLSLIWGLNLAAFSAVAFLWFIAVVRRRIGDREDRFFATVFFGGGILYVAIMLVGSATLASEAVAMQLVEGYPPNPDALNLTRGIGAALLLVVVPRVQAVFIVTTSTLIVRTGVLARWVAIVGFVMALVMFVIPLFLEPMGFAFPAWVAIVSIAILAGTRREP